MLCHKRVYTRFAQTCEHAVDSVKQLFIALCHADCVLLLGGVSDCVVRVCGIINSIALIIFIVGYYVLCGKLVNDNRVNLICAYRVYRKLCAVIADAACAAALKLADIIVLGRFALFAVDFEIVLPASAPQST